MNKMPDTKFSEWVSDLWGKGHYTISNKENLYKLFEKEKWIPKTISFDNNSIPTDSFKNIKILKPIGGFAGEGITRVKNYNEIKQHLEKNTKFKNWVLQDYIDNPSLFDGYKFHLRVWMVLLQYRNKTRKVYMFPQSRITMAGKKYESDKYDDDDIHDTHLDRNPARKHFFPEEIPDGWKQKDADKAQKQMAEILTTVMQTTKDMPFMIGANGNNGYYIYGVDFMFDNKKNPYLIEINEKTGLNPQQTIYMEPLVKLIFENKEDGLIKIMENKYEKNPQ
jgi:glutathionylspermidine synthase